MTVRQFTPRGWPREGYSMAVMRRALVEVFTSSSAQAFGPTLAASCRPVLFLLFAFAAGAALSGGPGAGDVAAAGVLALGLFGVCTGLLYVGWRLAFDAAWRALRRAAATSARPSGSRAPTASGPRLAA